MLEGQDAGKPGSWEDCVTGRLKNIISINNYLRRLRPLSLPAFKLFRLPASKPQAS